MVGCVQGFEEVPVTIDTGKDLARSCREVRGRVVDLAQPRG